MAGSYRQWSYVHDFRPYTGDEQVTNPKRLWTFLKPVRIVSRDAPPDPAEGQLYELSYDTTNKTLHYKGDDREWLLLGGLGVDASGVDTLHLGSGVQIARNKLLEGDHHIEFHTLSAAPGHEYLQFTLMGSGDVYLSAQTNAPNKLVKIGPDGKIPNSLLPDLAISQVYVVADEAARLALTVQEGDFARQLDTEESWIWDGSQWVIVHDASSVGPHSLTDHGDVSVDPLPDLFSLLRYDGALWVDESLDTVMGEVNLDDLKDVTAPTPSPGDQLEWNGAAWVPAAGGEVNTLALAPTATGADITEPKSGTELRVKGITGTGGTSVSVVGDDVQITSTAVPSFGIAPGTIPDIGTTLVADRVAITDAAGKLDTLPPTGGGYILRTNKTGPAYKPEYLGGSVGDMIRFGVSGYGQFGAGSAQGAILFHTNVEPTFSAGPSAFWQLPVWTSTNGGTYEHVAAGTTGQILTSNTGALPTWATPSADIDSLRVFSDTPQALSAGNNVLSFNATPDVNAIGAVVTTTDITLDAGTYSVVASCPAISNPGGFQLRLRKTTGTAAYVKHGQVSVNDSNVKMSVQSRMEAQFVVPDDGGGTATYQIHMEVENGGGSTGETRSLTSPRFLVCEITRVVGTAIF